MALLSLFFETLSKSLAGGLDLPLGFQLPALRQEEILQLDLSVTKQVRVVGPVRYATQNLTGWSARAAIGSANSVLAQANAFTIDATGTILTDTLDLNTAGINNLTDRQAGIYLELLFTDPQGRTYGRRFPVFIEKAIFTSGTIVAPPNDTAMGRLEAQRNFMLKEGAAGDGFILTSKDGLKRAFIYLHNDGSLKTAPMI